MFQIAHHHDSFIATPDSSTLEIQNLTFIIRRSREHVRGMKPFLSFKPRDIHFLISVAIISAIILAACSFGWMLSGKFAPWTNIG